MPNDRITVRLPFGRSKNQTVEEVANSVYPGWHDIIKNMFTRLLDAGWDGQLLEIKEKFGRLRVYISGGSEVFTNIILETEAASSRTCRVCGAPGELRYEGWIKCLCDKHEDIRR